MMAQLLLAGSQCLLQQGADAGLAGQLSRSDNHGGRAQISLPLVISSQRCTFGFRSASPFLCSRNTRVGVCKTVLPQQPSSRLPGCHPE